MALMQALSTGINGLNPHQKAMDNIGNNLANVNTVGYKKGVFQFSTLLEQSIRGGMGANEGTGRGSVNPVSLGLGAQTASINKVFTQGNIENTGNPNDMAIDGNGFFVLRSGNGFAYTRAGSFYRGEDGSLMAGNGLYVQGTMAVKRSDGSMDIPQDAKMQNIVIPIGTIGGHAQTTKVEFTGNLDSRQKISNGTSLFGGTSFPTVANLQSWMNPDFNGGDPITDKSVDDSWDSLEETSYAISQDAWSFYTGGIADGVIPPSNVSVYNNNAVVDMSKDGMHATSLLVYDSLTGARRTVDLSSPLSVADIIDHNGGGTTIPGYEDQVLIPMIQEVKTINGGNVQTSTAYGIKVPNQLTQTRANNPYIAPDGQKYQIANDITYPQWFYESTGANSNLSFGDIIALNSELADTTNPPTAERADEIMRSIWPNGINGENWADGAVVTANSLPHTGETYPATSETPLENLWYLKGNVWVQPFSNISNGDSITMSFTKGKSQVECDFVYNRPQGPEPLEGQVSIDRENSYTLEHLLKFMAGDVNEPTLACQGITPSMFGAVVSSEFPYGNTDPTVSPDFDKAGYEEALKNVALAGSSKNMDEIGGAMGLLSIPPRISNNNYGEDEYDVPAESAGAYTRTGVQTVSYDRWDPVTQAMVKVEMPSFNASIVSNLGEQNAISDIKFSFNNVPHDTMFNAEKEYEAAQGGSAIMSVDFYDSLGNPKTATVRLAMVSQDNNFTTWRWYADCDDDSDFTWKTEDGKEISTNLNVGTGLIRFDKNGKYVSGAEYSESGGITINQANQGVNEPILIEIMNGLSGKQDLDFSSLTCTAIANDMKLQYQNGSPPGTLDDFTVSLDGVVTGIYSNGNTIDIARVGLAMIPNENGLIAAGSNLFYTGPASGDARYGHAATGGTGSIRHMQLESSNVDLSEEFTAIISIERGFQANSRIITTADEMINELLSLKR